MSTTPAAARPTTFYTPAQIEAELASAPHPAVSPTCQGLCDEIQNDMDILQNLADFPVKSRGRIALAARNDLRAAVLKMKQLHCAACTPS